MSSYIHTSQKIIDSKMEDLSQLSQNIQTKDRLIQINQQHYEESKKKIKVLRKLYIPIFFNILYLISTFFFVLQDTCWMVYPIQPFGSRFLIPCTLT